MKKLLAISVLLNAALLAGILLKEKNAVVQAAGGGVPFGNGDVNGDGRLDIADAIYIINNQFAGGPAPVPIECPPMGLPGTGLTKCYSDVGEIDCTNADFPGQDGFYQAGCPNESRFVDHGDGTVTDSCTGLMWQKNTADVNGDGTSDGNDVINWQDALKYCEKLNFAMHDDWRLPNVRELQSIVDYGHVGPAIDMTVFGAISDWYWSSSFKVPILAWYVSFYDGSVNVYDDGGNRHFVRAVRSGP